MIHRATGLGGNNSERLGTTKQPRGEITTLQNGEPSAVSDNAKRKRKNILRSVENNAKGYLRAHFGFYRTICTLTLQK
jgi:hypothetical protein